MIFDNIKTVEDEGENVSKFVFSKSDAVAEAVLYRYPTYRDRTVICISTQSGCPIGCRFCGAGDYFVRSLTSEEIVFQAKHCLDEVFARENVHASEINRLQIMFMSMGEPLLNMKHLDPAIRELHEIYPNAALLISTSAPDIGVSGFTKLIELSIDVPTVGLQFSVHESTDEARNKLVPFKNKLSLSDIAFEGSRWWSQVGRNPFFNYCAHDGNSSDADADRIMELFPPGIWCATVSVICERDEGSEARNEHQRTLASEFASKLLARGYDTRMFDPAGQDTIGGGCGQLWFVQQWMKDHPTLSKPSVGFGKDIVHTPEVAEKVCNQN